MSTRGYWKILFAVMALLSFDKIAAAQDYPNKQITFIYPYSAGSPLGEAWRQIAAEASKQLGQPVIFENRPGAGGMVGFGAVMRAPADGYTIGTMLNGFVVWQPLIDPVGKNFVDGKDYEPINTSLEHYVVLVARKGAPFKTLPELIEYAKENPGKINAGSAGVASGGHFALLMLEQTAKIEMTHIAYPGTAPVLTALRSGEVDILFTDVSAKQLIADGAAVALGVGAPQRWSFLPDVPTMAEQGLTDFGNASSWSGTVAPAGLPADVKNRLSEAFSEAMKSPELVSRLEKSGWVVKSASADDTSRRIAEELKLFEPIIRAANIKPE